MNAYAGFWIRLGAFLIDCLCLLPIGILHTWSLSETRKWAIAATIPFALIEPAYMVILHGLRGQSLGKMALGLRVQLVDGQPISWPVTFLRFTPLIVWRLCYGTILMVAILSMTDSAFTTTPFMQKMLLIYRDHPRWAKLTEHALGLWVLAEAFTLGSTLQKRAIHDFIAGTVVVRPLRVPPVVGPAV